MTRKLTAEQIQAVCTTLLSIRRRVTVRDVRQALQERYGACGRTERVARMLRKAEEGAPLGSAAARVPADIEELRAALRAAEQRAARAEELERHHQDFWADRYAAKLAELERRYAATLAARPAITHEQYLQVHRRAVELARRLARYESIDDAGDTRRD